MQNSPLNYHSQFAAAILDGSVTFYLGNPSIPLCMKIRTTSDFKMTLDYLIFNYIEHFQKCDANPKMMTPAKDHMPFPPHLQWSGTDTPQQKVYHDIILQKTSQVEDQHQNGRMLATYWGRCKLPEYF